MPKKVRVAQILNRMDSGGIEAVVMNYYRNIDRDRVQIDFFLTEDSLFPQKDELEKLGTEIYMLPSYTKVTKYQKTLRRIFLKNDYDIVHSHLSTMSVFPLFAAKMAKIPVRICHNHSTAHWGEGVKTLLKYILRPFCKIFATHWFACGKKAAIWMYGKRAYAKGRVMVFPNAIDVKKYSFDNSSRDQLRHELNIPADTFVLGHVGRFTYSKNHELLLRIFEAMLKKSPEAKLLLIGEGELEEHIRKTVEEKKLKDHVIFTGARTDVNKLYSVMDVLCLPSFYEGMPLVAWEAQANGMPCVFSDRITKEVICGDGCHFISLDDPIDDWVNAITNCETERKEFSIPDIKVSADELFSFYMNV